MISRFLIDECVIGPLARAIADAGHDVAFVAGPNAGLSDLEVAARAVREGRIVLTQDYDFGELAVRHGVVLPGVVLVGCDGLAPDARVARVLAVLAESQEPLEGRLTVIEPERVRRRRLA